MRSRFDEQLAQLERELIEMGALCEESIALAAKSLGDGRLARQVAPLDTEIDRKERDIESLCLKLLLQQQPVARDLRQISAALKMITDLERIGDQATDIAEIMQTGSVTVPIKGVRLTEMAEYTMNMVNKSVESYVQKDLSMAKEVIDSDDTLDNLFTEVRQEINRCSIEGQYTNDQAMDMLMISKYYERIGDHADNLAGYTRLLNKRNISFSPAAQKEIAAMRDICLECVDYLLTPVAGNVEWLSEVSALEQRIDDMTSDYRRSHLERMRSGECSDEACIIYSELLTDFERIGDHVLNIAQEMAQVQEHI